MEFSHFDEQGNAVMVKIGNKQDSERAASARGCIRMSQECLQKVKAGTMQKGDVLGTARIAGIMGAKKTSELIPLCHQIALTGVTIEFYINEECCEIEAVCQAECQGKTGVEMEALTGVTTALLTIYDMCKAVDKGMEIGQVWLCRKSGGKSGTYQRESK